ncbi:MULTISPECIES: hypothetical protein [unclassified Nocardioides]|uniref:hypothetical protein n=1 Tax=unclassified Nocardioides TaxID=2615069 RepID=UPI0006F3F3C1|nr:MULTISPECIES: hypothetical protein [unclassified Nocardioides]KQY62445.1 hypothetical protein ASD30_24055 [Nocardioides sp. Root140]KQZ70604.1 hypothetical protein ASD66_13535 [Nocardioides sp. Root151]
MTENPNYDPQTRPNIGPGSSEPEPETPPTDPAGDTGAGDHAEHHDGDGQDGDTGLVTSQDPPPEGSQRENAETALDQPSEGSE